MKKTTHLFIDWFLACFLALLCAGPAQSATVTFNLNYEFSGAYEPKGTSPWLTASFVDTGSNEVTLTMSTLNLVADEFVSGWYFNFDPALDLTDLTFTHESGTYAADSITIESKKDKLGADGGGYYDILFAFPTSNPVFKTALTSVYNITYNSGTDSISALSFDFLSEEHGDNGIYHSATHVQGIGIEGTDDGSGWIGDTAVPIPPTFLLFGSCLVGMAGLRRRCRKSSH